MQNFSCVTTFFNPAGFKSLLSNYFVFAESLARQNVNLLTIELAFGDSEFQLPKSEHVVQLRSQSVMWQKERLINYGLALLPPECDKVGWVDCDVLFGDPHWAERACEELDRHHIIQLFKRVYYLPQGLKEFDGTYQTMLQGVSWQKNIHKNWLQRRKEKDLPFSAPGFAWAARRSVFSDIGIYDKNIIGSGDTFLVDCYFNSWEIHGYASKFNEAMKTDMADWRKKFDAKDCSVSYIPIDIYHLWHGNLKNRKYMERHQIIADYNYDPAGDIRLNDGVWEWASEKPGLHEALREYFRERQEDV